MGGEDGQGGSLRPAPVLAGDTPRLPQPHRPTEFPMAAPAGGPRGQRRGQRPLSPWAQLPHGKGRPLWSGRAGLAGWRGLCPPGLGAALSILPLSQQVLPLPYGTPPVSPNPAPPPGGHLSPALEPRRGRTPLLFPKASTCRLPAGLFSLHLRGLSGVFLHVPTCPDTMRFVCSRLPGALLLDQLLLLEDRETEARARRADTQSRLDGAQTTA